MKIAVGRRPAHMDVRRRQYKQDVYLPVETPFLFVTFSLGEQRESFS